MDAVLQALADNDRQYFRELAEDPFAICLEMRQHALVDHHFPPSIEITWPVIQFA